MQEKVAMWVKEAEDLAITAKNHFQTAYAAWGGQQMDLSHANCKCHTTVPAAT